MRTPSEIKAAISNHKDFLSREYHVKQIGLFGSYVNGNAGEDSDVDILVDFSKPVGLIQFIRLEEGDEQNEENE